MTDPEQADKQSSKLEDVELDAAVGGTNLDPCLKTMRPPGAIDPCWKIARPINPCWKSAQP